MNNIIESLLDIKVEDMKLEKQDSDVYGEILKKEINDKFLTPSKFSLEIERIVVEEECNHIDAILTFCEKNDIEIESVTKLISKPLKERLKYDAINLNFMKSVSKSKLPI
jgi:hypothetical protein